MQQLSGLDASFLYLETGTAPMHIGSLSIYDQSSAPGGKVTFKQILNFFEHRLHKARAFRQRIARVPLSLDHPYWIEDPDFDLEFHVRHIALPKPGDWRQLCIQTARLHARPLDRNKPLWEAYVIEGLDNVEGVPPGSFALVVKVHHAAIDGVSAAEITAAIHDFSPDAEVEEPDEPWEGERLPTGVELLTRTAANSVGSPFKFGKLLFRSTPSLLRVIAGMASHEIRMPVSVPRTRFNATVSPHRVFDARLFSLDDIKAIKNTIPGTTVNDLVVAICGGAMRRYLQDKEELPEESMVAMAPISVRTKNEMGSAGNLVSAMSLPVCSHIVDPIERLQEIHRESTDAKKLTYTMGPTLGPDAAEFVPSTVTGLMARGYASARLADRFPPLFNTVITNVPGASVPLYSMGCRMVAQFGLGPVTHGLGFFQTVLSYNGTLTISVVADRNVMPDPAFYGECLQTSFEELKAACDKFRADTEALGSKSKRAKSRKPGAAKAPAVRKKARSKKKPAHKSKTEA
jgi:WS/DGAT/MGAT family acyltransferase